LSEDRKKEVIVEPSFVPHLEKPVIVEDTIKLERQSLIKFSKKIGSRMSGLMICVGIFITFLSLLYILKLYYNFEGFPDLKNLLSPELMIILLGFLGVLNLICGFVLIAKE
jgi:hypothetical protein